MTYTNETGAPICTNAAKSAVVDCSSAEAAWVLVGEGGQLPDEVAAQYGLTKARRPAEDKALDPAEDKGEQPPPSVPRRR